MSITEFVESPGYKKIMAKVYGMGAAVVILGALWKILHLPGANYMLIAGLGTEAVIFFLSSFEPPHAMPDWSLVYPELVGLESVGGGHHGGGKGGGGGSDLAALIQSGTLEPDVVEKLSDGIRKLTLTTGQLSNLTDASLVTESYVQNMKHATETVSSLSTSQVKSVKTLEESATILSQSYTNTANLIASSGNKVVSDLASSGEKLVGTYTALNTTVAKEMELVAANSKAYSEQLGGLNKNLGSINSMFELQLKSTNEQVQASVAMTKGLNEIKDQLIDSVSDTKLYKEQVAKLGSSINQLNGIYGNMLSAMNTGNH